MYVCMYVCICIVGENFTFLFVRKCDCEIID